MSKKKSIPYWLKRKIAIKYKAVCQNCGRVGFISRWGLAYERKKEPDPHKGWDGGYRWIPMETAHIIPEFFGGEMEENNLVLMCRYCNRSLGANIFNKNESNNNPKFR